MLKRVGYSWYHISQNLEVLTSAKDIKDILHRNEWDISLEENRVYLLDNPVSLHMVRISNLPFFKFCYISEAKRPLCFGSYIDISSLQDDIC